MMETKSRDNIRVTGNLEGILLYKLSAEIAKVKCACPTRFKKLQNVIKFHKLKLITLS